MIWTALIILETISSTASIDLPTFRSMTSHASDAKAAATSRRSSNSHLDVVSIEQVAISALKYALPGLESLPGMSHAICILCVGV
jgi:hypothetical protein